MAKTLFDTTSASQHKDQCIIVIFGASGNLTLIKLMPALYNMAVEGYLPQNVAIVGVARRDKSDEDFRKEMREGILKYSRTKPEDHILDPFLDSVYYFKANFDEPEKYNDLNKHLGELDKAHGTGGNRLFYLSVQPSYFTTVVKNLSQANMLQDDDEKGLWSRVIIEKPFGHDLKSSEELQKSLLDHLPEKNIWRIDHYLGKETVQNILVFRYCNSIFENLWNNRYIDHVQITVAEDIGIETRGKFYEESGLLRDIIQNHMMQILSLVAMEPPVNLEASSVHNEKVKVIQSIRPFNKEEFDTCFVRGQYKEGFVHGQEAKAYRQEDNVDPKSNIETFTALKLFIENYRWSGVPFLLRSGKRLAKKATEITIFFKENPDVLFLKDSKNKTVNTITFLIQPQEGASMVIHSKVPGQSTIVQKVKMDFHYEAFFGKTSPEAYERLIYDCIRCDKTLFAREDEVKASWEIFDPILSYWKDKSITEEELYPSGSWGPEAAEKLTNNCNSGWRNP